MIGLIWMGVKLGVILLVSLGVLFAFGLAFTVLVSAVCAAADAVKWRIRRRKDD